MKNRATVSERGTITIPEPIRKRIGIHSGDLIEFLLKGNYIIIRHLIVKQPDEKTFLSDNDWNKFDILVQKQLKKRQYKNYSDLEKAKLHSRKLIHKK